MFYSKWLLSKKGPLGVIWVAAYFHTKLKKDQVAETDISSSVDTILLDEVPLVTYRVLSYLLLGVVRIYSKKVEYLFHDCHEVLIKINDFTVSKKVKAHREAMCAPYLSITLPDRFELDAFDLEVLEDLSGGNVGPPEEIMLQDAWKNEGIENYSLDKYHCEEAAAHLETFSTAYTLAEDVFSPHLMDIDMVVSTSHNLSNLEASMEKPRDNRFSQEECLDREMFCGAEEEPPDLVGSFGEEHHTDGEQIKFPEVTSSENGKRQVITEDHTVSTTLLATPESKVPDASGATTPEFMVIPTPTIKERARFTRKRKCFYDEILVLPNEVLRQRIHNPSDLVCKRRKAPHTALDAWKACQISNLSQGFLEPLIPCISLELTSLFCKNKLKSPEPVETLEPPDRVDMAGSPTVGRSSGQTAEPVETVVAPDKLDISGSPTVCRSSGQTEFAPETPVDHSTSRRLFEGSKSTNSDRVGPSNSSATVEKELPPSVDQELDLNMMNKEINSCDGYNQELHGWSVRTRMVARYLCRSFLYRKEQGEKEVVNSLQVLEGRTRKESASLFYEILVLKSEGYVDVKQDNPYEDILVWKTPQFEAIL